MNVEVVSASQNPLALCSAAAGCCYGWNEDAKNNYNMRRLETCMRRGHLSVFEHANVTWKVDGISRACSHQLVRHRLASYSQQSQRYCKIEVGSNEWYVKPPDVAQMDIGVPKILKDLGMDVHDAFDAAMMNSANAYKELLDAGVKPEDARYVLPNACKTSIFVTMNFREFMHFEALRSSDAAQWEIRILAFMMKDTLFNYSAEWAEMVDLFVQHYNSEA